MEKSTSPPEALGQSEAFLAFMERLSLAAKVDRPVLIIGERGTGKELAAARLHYLSSRWQESLVTLNCAALAPSLIEDELFGHEPGAFTGAQGSRQGRFEAAHQGTLFLDELGIMPPTVQEKVLRVVEYGSFERVGGSRSIQVDVRILGATNQNLKDLAQGQKFKQDLLDRLSFEVLMIPPLRQRGGDILLLANHFAARMSHELGRSQMPTLSPEAMSELMDYSWPGNVRELKNVVERAVYRSQEPVIKSVEFDPFAALDLSETAGRPPAKEIKPDPPQASFKEAVLGFERSLLQDALHKARFNQKRAAQDLGLTYHQLRGLLRKHGGLDNLLS